MRWLGLVVALLLALPALPAVAGEPPASYVAAQQARAAGDLPTALVQYRLALREARSAEDDGLEAECMVGLGRVHRELGRHADALRWFDDALKLDRQAGREAAAAADLLEIGLSHLELGDLREAKKRFRKAFDGYQAAGEPVGAADALVNLGLAEADDWNLLRAAELLATAEQLYTSAGRDDGVGDARTNRGGVLADLGRYGEAIEAQRAAIEAYERAGDPAGRGAALHNLGNVYAELGDWERAVGLYRQSRALLTDPDDLAAADLAVGNSLMAAGEHAAARDVFEGALTAAGPADAPGILLDLGEALEALGEHAAARSRFEQAAERAGAVGDEPTTVAALLAVGDVQRAAGEADAAFATCKRAGALATSLGVADLEWRAWHGMGLASRARGGDGLTPLRNAVTVLEDSRRTLEGLDPWAVRYFVEDRRAVYEDLIDALLASGDGASALLYTERLRVVEMDAGGAAADPVEQRYQALAGREVELQGQLQQEQRAPAGQRDEERIAALQEELARTRVEFSRYVDELRSSYPDFDRLVKVDPTDIEAYQGDLADDEVVLQPIVLPDRLAILVFSSGPLVFREVEVSREELEGRIGRVLRVMRSRRLSRPERLMEHLDALGSWLWTPVAADIEGKRRVIVAAGGPLRYLPYQLLRKDGRFLVQDHEVVNVTNVGSLKRRSGEGLRLGDAGLLALGNPDGTLPAADVEVDALGDLFPAARVLHGAEATRDGLGESVSGRSVLHLATHGVLDAQAPERSYIVLAPPAGGAAEEGRLGYLEIPGLYGPLQDTGMVVLSACETAVPLAPDGDAVQGGGLEIAGLANQFRRAGVPRLLASLWQVSDDSTRALMVRFYEALGEGRAPPEALAIAQRSLLANPEMEHPFYWAPFILIGTPR
jgi:CHAT domain-containing protein/tetratricopeptide (TPR) repeat protein